MHLTYAIAGCSLLLASSARADNTSTHGTVTGDIAVTDNVFAAPTDGNREGDLFFQIRPGLLYTYAAPRMIHDLSAEGEVIQYAFHSRDPSLSGRGGWRGFFIPGPRSELIMTANAGTGVLAALGSRLTPDQTMINVLPVDKVTVRQGDASQYFSYIATRAVRISQNAFARYNRSDDNADERMAGAEPTISESAEAGASIAFERNWRLDSVSFELGASVARLERLAPEGALMGDRLDRSVNPRARLQWRHDIDRRLSFVLDGGAVYVYPYGRDPYNPDEMRKPGIFPIAGGQFAVTEQWGRGTLSMRRDVTPNLFIAQNTVNDTAAVAAAVPLPWFDNTSRRSPKVIGLGSIAVQRTQLVDPETAKLSSTIGAARVDVGVAYTPRPGFSYTVRYELMLQTGDDTALDPLGNNVPVQGFFRNTIYFTFSARYPDRIAAAVPKRRSNNAVRADRKDMAPLGAEPVVPDLLEGSEEDDPR